MENRVGWRIACRKCCYAYVLVRVYDARMPAIFFQFAIKTGEVELCRNMHIPLVFHSCCCCYRHCQNHLPFRGCLPEAATLGNPSQRLSVVFGLSGGIGSNDGCYCCFGYRSCWGCRFPLLGGRHDGGEWWEFPARAWEIGIAAVGDGGCGRRGCGLRRRAMRVTAIGDGIAAVGDFRARRTQWNMVYRSW